MNRLCICIVFFTLAVIAARAEETNAPHFPAVTSNVAPSGVTSNVASSNITIDGTTYEEVRWGTVTPSTVTIFHKTGIATIPLKKLPPDLQSRFGYDPQKESQFNNQQFQLAQQQRRNSELLAGAREMAGTVIQVTSQGLLTQTESWRDTANDYNTSGRYIAAQGPFETVYGPVIMVVGHPRTSQFTDKQGIGFYGYRDGNVSYLGTDGAQHIVERWVYVSDEAPKK